jgi:hypothetical protein
MSNSGAKRLNRRARQFSRLLAAELCASAVVMLHTPRSEVVWRVLATHSIRQFPFHFPSRASPCAITFQPDSTVNRLWAWRNAGGLDEQYTQYARGGWVVAMPLGGEPWLKLVSRWRWKCNTLKTYIVRIWGTFIWLTGGSMDGSCERGNNI